MVEIRLKGKVVEVNRFGQVQALSRDVLVLSALHEKTTALQHQDSVDDIGWIAGYFMAVHLCRGYRDYQEQLSDISRILAATR